MTLFIDACARKGSRTRELARYLLKKLGGEEETVRLYEAKLPTVDEDYINMRSKGQYSDPSFDLARQFAAADEIVIAAPFWDNSFPAVLKKYIESICVTGLTFAYSEKGIPVGMCRAGRLWYVTTSGGPIFNNEYSFGYVKSLAGGFFGIEECRFISAENLDIVGNDPAAIVEDAKRRLDTMLEGAEK